MNIFINRRAVVGPWGGGNHFVKAFYEHIPSFEHSVYDRLVPNLDVIFIQDPRPDDDTRISINECLQYKQQNPNVKIIQRINECDARKNTNDIDSLLRECSKLIDKTVFVSNWMKEYHERRGWFCRDNAVVINGVESYFKPNKKFSNGKTNLVTHHWSNNLLKGFDFYDFIDEIAGQRDDISFTYIGRERGTFRNTKVIKPLYGKDLAEELGKYDVYVSASRFDPGPNHIIEPVACGIPTYSYKDGGGACEFTDSDHVFDSKESLLKIIEMKDHRRNEFLVRSWYDCMRDLNENTLLKCRF